MSRERASSAGLIGDGFLVEIEAQAVDAGAGCVDFGAPHGLIDADGVALLGTAVLPRLR
jgi:hypothetical protein